MATQKQADYLIIGGGIMGLAVAHSLRQSYPKASITLIEKESNVAGHASGLNSGVLHAGFYYAADSLKARFCRDGNAAMRAYVKNHNLRINDCHKVVVVRYGDELATLYELFKRGKVNGVELKLVDEKELADIEPNAKTIQQAIYSPSTAVVDPVEICRTLRRELEEQGVSMLMDTAYIRRIGKNAILAGRTRFETGRIINCAGLYADRIAHDFGLGRKYTIIPFKGVYLKYTGADTPVRPCVYPVPNLKNPFLGVHFSVTVDGTVKIGPTAIPAFWRENYQGLEGFSLRDAPEIIGREIAMFMHDANFRQLAITEMKKYSPDYMAQQAALMVKQLDTTRFTGWSRPGIRAQLLDKRALKLVTDFIVESDSHSVHVLNAVSPAFTSSFPFAEWIVKNHVESQPPRP